MLYRVIGKIYVKFRIIRGKKTLKIHMPKCMRIMYSEIHTFKGFIICNISGDKKLGIVKIPTLGLGDGALRHNFEKTQREWNQEDKIIT